MHHHSEFHFHNADRAAEILKRQVSVPHGCDINEETVCGSAAATVMTSSMIKQSLADLRGKLDRMKNDKQAVSHGISNYESKYR